MTKLTSEQKFIADLCEGFKDHVLDAMEQGIHLNFEDHILFLRAAMDVYADVLDCDDEAEASNITMDGSPLVFD